MRLDDLPARGPIDHRAPAVDHRGQQQDLQVQSPALDLGADGLPAQQIGLVDLQVRQQGGQQAAHERESKGSGHDHHQVTGHRFLGRRRRGRCWRGRRCGDRVLTGGLIVRAHAVTCQGLRTRPASSGAGSACRPSGTRMAWLSDCNWLPMMASAVSAVSSLRMRDSYIRSSM